MARPKRILWVDDEVDGLAPHRRFLEEQGFTVASAAHGDDALAMLRRGAYSAGLLGEEMPGRRGLGLLPEIRAIDAGGAGVVGTPRGDDGGPRAASRGGGGWLPRHDPRWLANPEGDRPPLSVDVGAEFLVPVLKAQGRVLFIVIDCLRLDQWEQLRDLVTPLFEVEESYYYSILPTATPFARNAIFSGLFPMEIAARHPDWWGQASDDESLNAHEGELLTEH